MSTLQIKEQFEVDAPPERVWEYLIDPERIVVCLPGATLDEIADERTFHGHMTVKVGPVTVAYKGTIEFKELDHEARHVTMQGTGREKGGAGTARMTMTSAVEALDSGGSRVIVESDVQLAGRIVRFGRGMIQSVSAQLFKQFTACVRDNLALAPEEADFEAAGEVPPEAAAGAAAEGEQGAEAEATAAAPEEEEGAEAVPSVPAQREAEPIRLIPILFKAFWEWVTKPFRRLFGRGKS